MNFSTMIYIESRITIDVADVSKQPRQDLSRQSVLTSRDILLTGKNSFEPCYSFPLNHDIAKLLDLISIQSSNLFYHKFLVRPAKTRWQKVEVIAEKTSEKIILWDLKVSDNSSINKI